MTEFEKVISFQNLYQAFKDSNSGKGNKRSAAKFAVMVLEAILLIIEELTNRTFYVSPYHTFHVYEPKEREIKTGAFKDKVIQHSLCDNVLIPRLCDVFITDNCAGQPNKGTLFGLDRLSVHMKNYYKSYGINGYILKCDITKFFYNISHQQLIDIVEYYFSDDPNVCWLCKCFIDSTDGLGIPLGNQINQVFALLYLDCLDKLITQEFGIRFYGRYMDDFYLFHPNREYLEYCLQAIESLLETLGLTLNSKTQIMPFKNGVSYLGFHTYVTADGKIIRILKNQNKRNACKKYTKMAKAVSKGTMKYEVLRDSFCSWANHVSYGNCVNLLMNMVQKINNILDNQYDIGADINIKKIIKRARAPS